MKCLHSSDDIEEKQNDVRDWGQEKESSLSEFSVKIERILFHAAGVDNNWCELMNWHKTGPQRIQSILAHFVSGT
jgi:hypothetical protein